MLEFETRLAALHLRAEERRDAERTHNRFDGRARDARAGLVSGYLRRSARARPRASTSRTRGCSTGSARVVAATAPETLRAYLAFTVVRALAGALPAHIDAEDFAFYGRRIRGQQEQHERTKRVIDAIGADLGEALAQRYVALNFPPEAKERARAWSRRSSRRCAPRSARASG